MKPIRKISRRSFVGCVVGGAAVGASIFGGRAGAFQRSEPQPKTERDERRRGCTDRDSGANADSPGRGRGTGRTDRDPQDPEGCGRRR